jgi:hypothetical protein
MAEGGPPQLGQQELATRPAPVGIHDREGHETVVIVRSDGDLRQVNGGVHQMILLGGTDRAREPRRAKANSGADP